MKVVAVEKRGLNKETVAAVEKSNTLGFILRQYSESDSIRKELEEKLIFCSSLSAHFDKLIKQIEIEDKNNIPPDFIAIAEILITVFQEFQRELRVLGEAKPEAREDVLRIAALLSQTMDVIVNEDSGTKERSNAISEFRKVGKQKSSISLYGLSRNTRSNLSLGLGILSVLAFVALAVTIPLSVILLPPALMGIMAGGLLFFTLVGGIAFEGAKGMGAQNSLENHMINRVPDGLNTLCKSTFFKSTINRQVEDCETPSTTVKHIGDFSVT